MNNIVIRKLLLLSIILLVAGGCGTGKQKLHGTVTFSDDGSPLTYGVVCFTDGLNFSRGELKNDGSYAVATLGNKDGIPKGEYRVYIQNAVTVDENGNPEPFKRSIAERFTSEDTSGLTFTADGKTFRYDIKVDRP